MEIRRIRPGEHEAVGVLTEAAYEPFLTGPDDDYRERLRDTACRDREAEVWVAVDDDRVLGSVTVCPDGSSWREIAEADEGEFRMLAVDPDAQGRGVGRALVELCLDRFRASGASAVALSSLDDMHGAHRLYERLGFEACPARDWRPRPDVSLLAYRKELG